MSRRPGAIPLYREIEASIRGDIESGRYAVGDDLPTESELCEAYDVSRFTIREALRRIEDAGYIRRHQGRGSRVTACSPSKTFVLSGPSETDLLRYVEATSVKQRLVPEPMTQKLAREVGVDDPERWIHYGGLRRSVETGQPVGAFDAFVVPEYEVELEAVAEGRPLFVHVMDEYGLRLAFVDQNISATRLPSLFARRLQAEADEPALRIVRKFVAEEVGVFQITVSFHPADRFHYQLRLAAAAHRAQSDEGAADTPEHA
jgi:GntR family transcriptional regulator